MRGSRLCAVWKIIDADYVGHVEAIGQRGLFFHNSCMLFRNTSSNTAKGEVFEMEIHNINAEYRKVLEESMETRTPVKIHIQSHLVGSPLIGRVALPNYCTSAVLLKPTATATAKD